MVSDKIVVLGAGVTGLTTALLLSRKTSNDITVVAKHMPGDYDIEYCSPWAGANFLPVSAEGSPSAKREIKTWPVLQELARDHPDAGVHFQNAVVYNRKKDSESAIGQWFAQLMKPNPWYKDLVPDYRAVPANELGLGVDNANKFTSICLNAPVYLAWLVSQCRKNGVVFKRGNFKHVSDAANVHHSGHKADLVVNCTGLSSRTLGGVEDKTLYPARGQIVLVRNSVDSMSSISGCDDGDDETSYTMMRAAGGGTVIGGSFQKHNWDPNPDPNLAQRIMKRAIQMCPELVGTDENGKPRGVEALDIIRHGVGLRPLREDGIRIEKEKINGVWVVHNYGHAGYGYQMSYGCAGEAVGVVEEALSERQKARL